MPSQTFNGVGWHVWEVPEQVTEIQVDLRGAGSLGREGGRVLGKFTVTPGEILQVHTGEAGFPAVGSTGGSTARGGGGHGGNGYSNRRGGDGGGGASMVRRNETWGPVVAVAGGAGGRSGDAGLGGQGGSLTGGEGQKGAGDPHQVVDPPTGGTQSGPGQGGINRLLPGYNGDTPSGGILSLGGRGGQQQGAISQGGGGGGGGYHPGGGGTASSVSFSTPACGGAGGSNFIGGMYNASTYRGDGGLGIGTATFTWVLGPPAPNLPPTPPADVYINGEAEYDGFITRSRGWVRIEAEVNDPNARDVVRLIVQTSPTLDFSTYTQTVSRVVSPGERVEVTVTDLAPNTHYYARLWTIDLYDVVSTQYNAINFWTNRPPNPPELLTPAENSTVPISADVYFDWRPSDPDDPDPQAGFQIRWRIAASATVSAGEWVTLNFNVTVESEATISRTNFVGDRFYEWQIQTRDAAGVYGDWSLSSSWYALGLTTPPRPQHPHQDEAVEVNRPFQFEWRFVDPDPTDHQTRADIRYRLVGQSDADWLTLLGQEDQVGTSGLDPNGNATTGVPGSKWFWPIVANLLDSSYHYEWQARTYDMARNVSEWSDSATFWTVAAADFVPLPGTGPAQGALGCGEHRVFIYQAGGRVLVGEVTPIATLTYGRLRDDISGCLITTNGFGDDCGQMLGDLHCWLNEVVVFREGVRVWEGPVTRIGFSVGAVEIEAKDVMAYVYRRIMRQGYNDSYRVINGQQVGLTTVVKRAARIIQNALAPWDYNILPYLTQMNHDNDARQSRVVPDYAKTAWEEVDDLAATAGLDYTTVGRRIILWDTHRPIGRLPELRDKDFSTPPVITEYGMQLCNYFAVTNGSGVWGAATPLGQTGSPFTPYGPVELLASAYGEADGGSDDVLTPAAQAALVKVFEAQARRGINDRWPTPMVVRVPDNSALSAEAPIGLDQLVPGVWLPVRTSGTIREVSQWQKLDSVTVDVTPSGELIQVVMSPAPNEGQDPDSAPNE